MSVFVWKHGMRRSDARKQLELRLVNGGYADKVIWRDDSFHSVIGWGSVLDLAGYVDDDAVVIEKSNGLIGSAVLAKTETTLRDIFPVNQSGTFDEHAPDGPVDSKPFHPGRAAQNGMTAAYLAAKNFTSSERGIEAPRDVPEPSSRASWSSRSDRLFSKSERRFTSLFRRTRRRQRRTPRPGGASRSL